MSIETVTHDQMQALQALSATNLKVSEARALLSELEETETVYLEAREKKAMARITALLEKSRDVIRETKENYDEVQRFHQTVSSFADFLKEGHARFQSVLTLYSESEAAWNASMEEQETELAQAKQDLSVDRIKLANEGKSIESSKKELESANRRLESDRGALERAIIRFKSKRI